VTRYLHFANERQREITFFSIFKLARPNGQGHAGLGYFLHFILWSECGNLRIPIDSA
jgi:hypothetical protein